MDPYKVLGISRSASAAQVKAAYRRLALKWHPDQHAATADGRQQQQAAERFKQVVEAYNMLSHSKHQVPSSTSSSSRPSHPSYSSPRHRYRRSSWGSSSTASSGSDWAHSSSSSAAGGSRRWFSFGGRVVSPIEMAWQLGIAGVALFGIVFVGQVGDAVWQHWNRGKSFDETMERIDRSRQR